jgi:hypothetical protein
MRLPAVIALVGVLLLGELPELARADNVQGIAPTGSSTLAIRPVQIGVSLISTAVPVQGDAGGAVFVTTGVNLLTDTLVGPGTLTSNGTTKVSIAAATAGKTCYLYKATFVNLSTSVTHTVTVYSGTTVIDSFPLSPATSPNAGGIGYLQGYKALAADTALAFAIDSGGSSTDVTCVPLTVTK